MYKASGRVVSVLTHGFFQEMVFIDIYTFNGRQNEGQTNLLILIFNEPFVP